MKEVRSRRHTGSIWATPSGSPWATVDTESVMESAEVRNRHDPTEERGLAVPWVWAVLVQRLMWARGVVVDLVGPQEPVEVPLVQDEEVVEALASD